MASVKISELTPLEIITSDDFIPIVDSGSGTTYRATFNTLNGWMKVYGTASYASSSLSASYALTSSYAISSSWALSALTASYVSPTTTVPSASWASSSISASYALTASSLQGNGSSWESLLYISSSLVIRPSASFIIGRKKNPIATDITKDCIWLNSDYNDGIHAVETNDFGRIYFTEQALDLGRVVFELGDNRDASYGSSSNDTPNIELLHKTNGGFLFSTINSDGWYGTGSLLFIASSGKVYARGLEARDYSQSLVNQVGFYGTASCALTASYVTSTAVGGGIPIGGIIDYGGGTPPTGWAICDGSALNRTTYADLFSIIGTTWGVGDGATTFNIPDLRKRMTVGANGILTKISGSSGSYGGSEAISSHYHAIARTTEAISAGGTTNDDIAIPWIGNKVLNQTHHFPLVNSPAGLPRAFYFLTGDNSGGRNQPYGYFSAGAMEGWMMGTSFALARTGSTDLTDLMPPYAALNKIIRTQ